MSARSENSNTNLAGFLFFFLGGILNMDADGGRGNGESCGGGQRESSEERVTGGRWRRVVLGDVLAEQELELGGRARCLAVEVAGDVCGSGRTAGYVFRCGTPSTPLFVVCVASPVGRPTKDCWSDPKMAGAEPTLWGSGASRRRQSIPDDLHISQSCPGDSEHGSGRDLARSRGHGANRHGAVLWNGLRNTCLENARRAQ